MISRNIKNIKDNYKDNDNLLIVGLGDEKGVNYKKNVLMILRDALQSSNYDIKVIDAFSSYFNKCRHIDSYLNNNVSTYELSLINMYGTREKIKESNNLLSKPISYIASKTVKTANEEFLFLSSEINKNEQPVIIYSCGFNDLIELTNTYKSEKANIIKDRCSKNVENILKLNNNSKICMVGSNINMYKDNKLNNYALIYNDVLKKICHEYGLIYVGTRSAENTDYYSSINTNFSGYAHYLASRIIKELSFDINNTSYKKEKKYDSLNYESAGVFGMITDVTKYEKSLKNTNSDSSKQKLDNEIKVLKKVIY